MEGSFGTWGIWRTFEDMRDVGKTDGDMATQGTWRAKSKHLGTWRDFWRIKGDLSLASWELVVILTANCEVHWRKTWDMRTWWDMR